MPPVTLITGASRGLGRGIALELARAGWSCGINYAGNQQAAEETVAQCQHVAPDAEQRFIPLQADIGQSADRQRLVQDCLRELGRIDSLVNNAGVAPSTRADLLEAGEDSFDRLLAINSKGPHFLTQLVARYWLEQQPLPLAKYFSVVFVTSISAHTVSTARGEYCISKAASSMSAHLWSARLAADGIPVYEVRPGIMQTDMTSAVSAKYDALIAEGLVPQGRWGTPQDLGLTVKALVGGDFPFSTGAIVDVDGGFQLRRL